MKHTDATVPADLSLAGARPVRTRLDRDHLIIFCDRSCVGSGPEGRRRIRAAAPRAPADGERRRRALQIALCGRDAFWNWLVTAA